MTEPGRSSAARRLPASGLRRVGLGSIAVASVVIGLKFAAYWQTGSAALYSDALESIVNVATALIALYAIHIAHRPADRRHQFGHHKAEYFAAVAEGVLVVVAALLILHEAYDAFVRPRALSHLAWGLGFNVAATAINAAWSALLLRWGRRQRSPALVADGTHLLTDVVTSAGVLAGLGLAAMTGWAALDAALAAAVALYILWAGWRLAGESIGGLMDEAVPADTARRLRQAIAANEAGAIEVHDIRTRSAGHVSFIEFHLVVPGTMTVADSHAICDRLEAALGEAVPGAQVLIHVEPEEEAKRVPGA
jgi:cation diffusion facilitator family transporter